MYHTTHPEQASRVVQVTRAHAAPREHAFLHHNLLAHWRGQDGFRTPRGRLEIEPREGGRQRKVMAWRSTDVPSVRTIVPSGWGFRMRVGMMFVATVAQSLHAQGGTTPVAIGDAIGMVRIEDRNGTDDRFSALSPDGTKFAAVVWHGDLERDVNIYSILVIDVRGALANPPVATRPVISIPFDGDSTDHFATPIEQLRFLADNRTVTFLGTVDGEPRQVWALDTETGDRRALTHHPTDLSGYAVAGDGRIRVYLAATPDVTDATRIQRLRHDGFPLYDPELLGDQFAQISAARVLVQLQPRSTVEYFRPGASRTEPEVVTGADQLPERLPPSMVITGLWAPDESSLVLRTAQGWREVEPGAPDGRPVPVPQGWSAMRWDEATGLILRRGDSLAAMRKAEGDWEGPFPLGVLAGLNRHRPVLTDGRTVIGVRDSLTVPPEFAAFDLNTAALTVLTELNPELVDRAYGEVEQLRFSNSVDSVATGWLIKPPGFTPGHRYPLVVLHANQRERPQDFSYLIDGRNNFSGHAAQTLAGHGFMVLFMGEPQYNGTRVPAPGGRLRALPQDVEAARENVEEAIRALVRLGYVDSLRVGISGWSRSAWYTDHLLMRSPIPFAAASQIDGGTRQYNARNRPYTDAELDRIRTPLLMQHHGLLQLVTATAMADRLRAMGRPIDFLYFPTAPHATKGPRHRWLSLTTHVDWWRFWLQDHEDPDPSKASQYQRWRGLREQATSTRR